VVTGFLAAVYIANGDLARAESVLEAVLDEETAMHTLGQRLCSCSKAELALARGQADQALFITAQLSANVQNMRSDSLDTLPRLALLHGEALVASMRLVEGEATLQMACRGSIRQGARPLLWRAHVALGRLYLTQGRGDTAASEFENARRVIEAVALTIPDENLHNSFLKEAMAQLPQPRSPRRQATQTWSGLSPREREVAMLIAQGKNNSEIAETLVVGKRTVETHVSSIFSKLGFSHRAQLITWVLAREQTGSGQAGSS
jgi:ATP/maltotriose-dependent transcriptional regulator MalT